MSPKKRFPLVSLSMAGVVVLFLGVYLGAGWSEEGVRIVVRWTAKFGSIFFITAFSTGPLHSLWHTPLTRWLMRNRRGLGLSFALIHTAHLAALILLGVYFPKPFVEGLTVTTLVGGGIAYAFLYAMVATSNDASVRLLGARRWRTLHTVGSWYIWIIFAQSYFPRALHDSSYFAFVVLLLVAPALRFARWARVRRPGGPSREAGSI